MLVKRYFLELTDEQVIELPGGSTPLSAGKYKGRLVVFVVQEESEAEPFNVHFIIPMTGPTPEGITFEGLIFLGSVDMGGGYHRHVFYKTGK